MTLAERRCVSVATHAGVQNERASATSESAAIPSPHSPTHCDAQARGGRWVPLSICVLLLSICVLLLRREAINHSGRGALSLHCSIAGLWAGCLAARSRSHSDQWRYGTTEVPVVAHIASHLDATTRCTPSSLPRAH